MTVYQVVSVKGDDPRFVAVDGGMADNMEVALYGQRFEATLTSRVGGGGPVELVGRHCESGDRLISGVPLRDPRPGDLLAMPVTGAYCGTHGQQLQRRAAPAGGVRPRRPAPAGGPPRDAGRLDVERRAEPDPQGILVLAHPEVDMTGDTMRDLLQPLIGKSGSISMLVSRIGQVAFPTAQDKKLTGVQVRPGRPDPAGAGDRWTVMDPAEVIALTWRGDPDETPGQFL